MCLLFALSCTEIHWTMHGITDYQERVEGSQKQSHDVISNKLVRESRYLRSESNIRNGLCEGIDTVRLFKNYNANVITAHRALVVYRVANFGSFEANVQYNFKHRKGT